MAKKLLIIEDDEILRKTVAGRLSGFCTVLESGDGEDGITKFVDEKPDLILLDLLLPKLDGFKILERIRDYPDKQMSQVSVVVFSNLWSDKDILQAKALKVDDYYVKANTNIEDVFNRIKSILLKKAPSD